MSLPLHSQERQLVHRRAISVEIFTRADGLWEVDATLLDTKNRDIPLANGVRAAGMPIHDMLLRLVVDDQFNILAAGSLTRAMPYPGQCNQLPDGYSGLVGMNLLRGFRAAIKARFAGVNGCTHISELAQVLPTAVIQAFAGIVLDTKEGSVDGGPPFQIDRCHALRREGEAVRVHYPRWYRPASPAVSKALPADTTLS